MKSVCACNASGDLTILPFCNKPFACSAVNKGLTRPPCQEIIPALVAPFLGSMCVPKIISGLHAFSRPTSAVSTRDCASENPDFLNAE